MSAAGPVDSNRPSRRAAARRGLQRVLAATSELSLARSEEAIMRVVRSTARDIAAADGATFVLRQGDFCYYADEEAIAPLWKGKRFPLQMCISGWVMLHREPALIEDVYADPRVPIDAYRPTFVKSLAMVPIRRGAPIGAIGVYWATRHAPCRAEVDLLQALSDVVSVAMQNVALYAELDCKIAELDRSNRAKDDFLATLSHELRTPMNAIHGWAQALVEGDLTPEETRLAIETIERNARAEIRLIQDLLDTTAIVTGNLALRIQTVDGGEIVRAAACSLAAVARKRAIDLGVVVPADAIGELLADPDRVHQVLINVIGNAIKFTEPGGHVRVELGREGPSAAIEVVDDGVGIAPEVLPWILDRFRQGDGSATRAHGGLGLGLWIARHLVEAHGGEIAVRSAGPGRGTSVRIRLPLATVAA